MKSLARFLMVVLCVAPLGAARAVVSSTAGSNLTAYNGESGSSNNNRWNTMTNVRSGGDTAATADFGNCNAVILRCAQPKCANGGCTDLTVTSAIVSGCVQSNSSCRQYGDDLVQYISAQLVASSTAKANAAANAAQTAAANAAAAQSAQQMAQMQAQMQQMQSQMASQNAQQMAQLQSALEEQKQLTANAIAEVNAARAENEQQKQSVTNGLSDSQIAAAQNGVSADVLAREQIAGQIMSSIENVETQLKTLKTTMTDAFNYAGCDSRGNNCSGPKRVKIFKQKAEGFFDPYENVLDEMYDALILAQSVGVDITDIYMMLNGTCNAWAQYLCTDNQVMHYTSQNCQNGKSVAQYQSGWTVDAFNTIHAEMKQSGVRGGANCVVGQVVPMSDGGCQLIKMLSDKEEVQRNWLYPQEGDDSHVRVGCASEALDNSALFRNRKKQSSIDIETLQKMIAQDAPASTSRYKNNKETDKDLERIKYCAVGSDQYANLQKWAATKNLPKNVCMTESSAISQINKDGFLTAASEVAFAITHAQENYNKCQANGELAECTDFSGTVADYSKVQNNKDGSKCCLSKDAILCLSYGDGKEWANNKCVCSENGAEYRNDTKKCMTMSAWCRGQSMEQDGAKCVSCEDFCTKNKDKDSNGNLTTCGDKDLPAGKRCDSTFDSKEKKCKCTIK